jgi:hypothetical protein
MNKRQSIKIFKKNFSSLLGKNRTNNMIKNASDKELKWIINWVKHGMKVYVPYMPLVVTDLFEDKNIGC